MNGNARNRVPRDLFARVEDLDAEGRTGSGMLAQRITRAQLLKGAAGASFAVMAGGVLAACGSGDDSTSTSGASTTSSTSVEDLGPVGGTLVVLTYEGYDGGAAIKPWLKENDVQLRFEPINSQQEATARLKGPAGDTIDVVELALLEGQSYIQLGIPYPLQLDWFSNAADVRPFFLDLFTQDDGTLSGMPFVWGALPANYRPDLTDPITSWQQLLEPKFKDRIALIDDALSNVSTCALALGYKEPATITTDQLDEVTDMMTQLVGNARTVAASYGDLVNLLADGEIYSTFSGWNALEAYGAAANTTIKSAYPDEGTVGIVDAHAIPKEAPNKGTAAAFINEFIGDTMQRYCSTDLASGIVRTDADEVLKGEPAPAFDYEDFDELVESKLVFTEAAPLESEGDVANREQWLAAWEQAKSG